MKPARRGQLSATILCHLGVYSRQWELGLDSPTQKRRAFGGVAPPPQCEHVWRQRDNIATFFNNNRFILELGDSLAVLTYVRGTKVLPPRIRGESMPSRMPTYLLLSSAVLMTMDYPR